MGKFVLLQEKGLDVLLQPLKGVGSSRPVLVVLRGRAETRGLIIVDRFI